MNESDEIFAKAKELTEAYTNGLEEGKKLSEGTVERLTGIIGRDQKLIKEMRDVCRLALGRIEQDDHFEMAELLKAMVKKADGCLGE